MAAAPGSAAVAELIGANGGRWVSSAGGAFAVRLAGSVEADFAGALLRVRPGLLEVCWAADPGPPVRGEPDDATPGPQQVTTGSD